MSKQIRVAVLFWRFGPYHHARLNAAGKLMTVIGVEACGMDDTYAWEKVEGAAAFTRVTLAEQYVGQTGWQNQLARQMHLTLNEIKPDVVVIPGWASADALSALSWCTEQGVPAVMMSESTEWDGQRTSWKEWIKRRLAGRCATFLVGGKPHKDYMEKLGVHERCIFLGYDAVDNEYFTEGADEARAHETELRNKLGLPNRFFLASARFIEKKNLPRLIEAYSRYRQTICKEKAVAPWDLVLLGDGPLRKHLESQMSSLDLNGSVLLPGFKQYPTLPTYYGLASAFIHASTVEQWGLVVNEAMASRLPVLVSDRCGCAHDLVQNGVNGYTFDPYQMESLSELMVKLSRSATDLPMMGQASEKIISEWGPGRFADGLSRAVDMAIKLPRRSSNPLDRFIIRTLLKR